MGRELISRSTPNHDRLRGRKYVYAERLLKLFLSDKPVTCNYLANFFGHL